MTGQRLDPNRTMHLSLGLRMQRSRGEGTRWRSKTAPPQEVRTIVRVSAS